MLRCPASKIFGPGVARLEIDESERRMIKKRLNTESGSLVIDFIVTAWSCLMIEPLL